MDLFFLIIKVIKQYVGYFPKVLLSATVSPITRTVLKVTTNQAVSFLLAFYLSNSEHQTENFFWHVFFLGGFDNNARFCLEGSVPWYCTAVVDSG